MWSYEQNKNYKTKEVRKVLENHYSTSFVKLDEYVNMSACIISEEIKLKKTVLFSLLEENRDDF